MRRSSSRTSEPAAPGPPRRGRAPIDVQSSGPPSSRTSATSLGSALACSPRRAATRQALEREWVAASNRRDLGRVRLDFATKLEQFTAQATGEEADLTSQIQALQDAGPELSSRGAAPTVVTTPSRTGPPSGVWALIYRLLALERSRGTLKDLRARTTEIVQSTDGEVRAARQTMRPVFVRLRALAKEPAVNGPALAADQEEFRHLLEQAKRLGAVMLPLREESALLHRYAADVQGWMRAVDREIGLAFRGLALELAGVGLALVVILVGSVVWRVAAVRYVTNPYHRRLLLTARHVVVVTAIALVLVLRFMSELTALVAALGFAAAGIAFALQNVILAVAGYFSMVAPNGIRVGDRVSLQGPFGYVHGEVIEIGVVRTRLQELSGEPLRPTGRILVFPNSVAFTGSFIKHPHPPRRSAPARRRSPAARRGSPHAAVEDAAAGVRGTALSWLRRLCVAHATHCRPRFDRRRPRNRTPGSKPRAATVVCGPHRAPAGVDIPARHESRADAAALPPERTVTSSELRGSVHRHRSAATWPACSRRLAPEACALHLGTGRTTTPIRARRSP